MDLKIVNGSCATNHGGGEDGQLKQTMIKSSSKTTVLCNVEKLESSDFFKVVRIDAVDSIITELPSNDKRLDVYRQFDVEII